MRENGASDLSQPVKFTTTLSHAASPCAIPHSALRIPHSAFRGGQRGVALVITLILLSIITFLSVTFLMVSRRERGAVTQSGSLTIAEAGATTARERAISEIVSRMMSETNLQAMYLVISTNIDIQTNVAANTAWTNLFLDPRPPVFITRGNPATTTFPFYLDLNRNSQYEQTLGDLPGDPEWIGVKASSNPNLDHSKDNPFLLRYAYLALPVGKMLDANAIHNHSKTNLWVPAPPSGLSLGWPITNGYMRNQGVGSWELNLAAMLVDLNQNIWPPWGVGLTNYNYETNLNQTSSGLAFDDAQAILNYRYATNSLTLMAVTNYLNVTNVPYVFTNADQFDNLGNGPYQVGVQLQDMDRFFPSPMVDWPGHPWPGGLSTNQFFTISDFFDATKTSPGFVGRLKLAGSRTNDYDRYSLYRLISQLGTECRAIADQGNMHLNYENYDSGQNAYLLSHATNLYDWSSYDFFMHAANLLIQDRPYLTNVGIARVSDIMIYPTNQYTPEIHQLLQLTANLYDSTRYDTDDDRNPHYPTVFRPRFRVSGGNIYLSDYVEAPTNSILAYPIYDMDSADPTEGRPALMTHTNTATVWGIPALVGARKGYPNFNEFSLETYISITRKLVLRRGTIPPYVKNAIDKTNAMYILSITNNTVGVEGWNSYREATNRYPRGLAMYVTNYTTMVLSNASLGLIYNPLMSPLLSNDFYIPGPLSLVPAKYPTNTAVRYPTNLQAGWYATNFGTLTRNFTYISNYTYYPNSSFPYFHSTRINDGFEQLASDAFPKVDWFLIVSSKVRYILVDTNQNRVVDYANLKGLDTVIDIGKSLTDIRSRPFYTPWLAGALDPFPDAYDFPQGIENQIKMSAGIAKSDAWWPASKAKKIEIANFCTFLGLPPGDTQATMNSATNQYYQAPLTPTIRLYHRSSWQVNDPLVHAMPWDLCDEGTNAYTMTLVLPPGKDARVFSNLGKTNFAYRPWGVLKSYSASDGAGGNDPFKRDRRVKDPLVRGSDDWQFPHAKYANIGWLGRVHRGTPWQTVYLKPEAIDGNDWVQWAYALATHPTNDWRLLDLFTVAQHPNATVGLMPVNQTNVAAWSATLSGVFVFTNELVDTILNPSAGDPQSPDAVGAMIPHYRMYTNEVMIQPGSAQVQFIVDGISRVRNTLPNQRFTRVSELLLVPEFTVLSPFINTNSATQLGYGISDQVYECLPEKIMSLLRMEESRYVIYAWGQALKPAANSIQIGVPPGDPRFKLCTNYQITAEMATRTVLRVEDVGINTNEFKPKVIIERFNVLPPD